MTEEEAKTKWCCGGPMQFLAASTLHSGDNILPDEGRCVASACMAWRWVREVKIEADGVDYGHGEITGGRCGLAR